MRCSFFSLVLLCAPAQAAAPLPEVAPQAEGFSPARLSRLDDFMRSATDADGYLGGVVLVARNGHSVDWRAFGSRDLARRVPMQRNDIFRIYSMTKTVASVAVLMLMEEGRLQLDDQVSMYLPELASVQVLEGGTADSPVLRAPKRPITLRLLLTHTAGFPAGLPGDDIAMQIADRVDAHGAKDLQGFVERLSKVPLAGDPGTRFGYDAAAIETLSRVVEVVSKQPFETFLQTRIFDPLHMADTGFSVPPTQRDRVVDITTMNDAGKLVIDGGISAQHPGERLNAYSSGAGGLYSTAADYARFCQMLLAGGTLDGETLLGRKTVELMLQNHLTMLDPPVHQFSDAEGFGLGGSVVLDVAKRGVPGSVGQFGWTGAASTAYWIDPTERLVAILLLQHIPTGKANDLPRLSRRFQTLIEQALIDEAPDAGAATTQQAPTR